LLLVLNSRCLGVRICSWADTSVARQNVEVADSYKSLSVCLLKDRRRHIPEASFIKKLLNLNLHLLRLGQRKFAL